MKPPPRSPGERPIFRTTRWSRVCLAKANSDDGRRALAELCDAYYEPVVAYLRHYLREGDTAREMSHEFFAEILGGGRIDSADRALGSFRSYLRGAVKHFVSRKREMQRTLKRGGGKIPLPFEDAKVSEMVDANMTSPDADFDRQWALIVLERSLSTLRAECVVEGRGPFFDLARPMLTGDSEYGDQGMAAASCGMNVAAFRVAVHRLKRRLRQCVKAEVSGTLDDDSAVTDEMQILMEALGV